MIEVTFYKFQKKSNSTKIPSGTFKKYSCVLKDDTSIINPVLEIHENDKPFEYNYCYIPEFKRYYKINDWSFYESIWTASCSVDVLASFKNYIGESNLYILRSASDYDGTILDNYYPAKTNCTFSKVSKGSIFSDVYVTAGSSETISMNRGCCILGFVSKNATVGSIRYAIVSPSQVSTLVTYLLDSIVTLENGFTDLDASLELQKNIVDPLQYIKSCMWLPFGTDKVKSWQIGGASTSTTFYNWTVPINHTAVGSNIHQLSTTFEIRKHPQTASRGNYVNTSPYTKITLFYPPFGTFDIDTTVSQGASTITTTVLVDLIDGSGTLIIKVGDVVTNRVEAKIGVNIALTQVSQDVIGATTSAVGGVAAGIGQLFFNPVGAVTSAVNGIASATESLIPRSNTIGGGGGFSDVYGSPELMHQFFNIVDEDIDHAGRPLCSNRKINSLNGYVLCRDGEIQAPATSDELEMISSYLTGGFFYE